MSNPFPTDTLSRRISKLQAQLAPKTLLILSSPADITYFSGFQFLVPEEREALLLITPTSTTLLYASFSPYNSHPEIKLHQGCSPYDLSQVVEQLHQQQQFVKIFVDPQSLYLYEYQALAEMGADKIKNLDRSLIWRLRTRKDEIELQQLRAAANITRNTMTAVLAQLHEGITERELQHKIEAIMRQFGSDQVAFPTIVAFGAHAALPHHQPTTDALSLNTPVLLDFGATVHGYRADMTRTIWFGSQPNPQFIEVAELVTTAYQEVLRVIAANPSHLTAQQLDETARNTIANAGYAKNFIHTTGHGVGLDIHESLSLHSHNSEPILPGMIITVEPGIYLEDAFGYRHENTVLITTDGAIELTADTL